MKLIFLLTLIILGYSCSKSSEAIQKEAINFQSKKCEEGNLDSCKELANIYVSQDLKNDAKNIWAKNCDKGFGNFCLHLAIESNNDDLYIKACELGEVRACTILSDKGGAFQKVAASAAQKACDEKKLKSCLFIVHKYQKAGKISQAEDLALEVCDAGEVEGCHYLANFENEIGNEEEALAYAKKACQKSFESCSFILKYEKKKGNTEELIKIYSRLCLSKEYKACDELPLIASGKDLFSGEKAALNSDCEAGDMGSCYILGVSYEVSGKKDEAKDLYELSCKGSFKPACSK